MVMNMNKTEFINELSNDLSYSKEQCTIINEIFENNFFLSKKNKDRIIEQLTQELNITYEDAINIYNTARIIIQNQIKDKFKHPFKSKD